MVTAELEQRQLLAGLLSLWPAYDHEAIPAWSPDRLVTELGDLDAAAGGSVAQVSKSALDRREQTGNDDETGLMRFEPFDQVVIVKPLVRAHDCRSHAHGKFGEAGFEQIKNSGGGIGIAGPQFAVPEVTTMTLEAE